MWTQACRFWGMLSRGTLLVPTKRPQRSWAAPKVIQARGRAQCCNTSECCRLVWTRMHIAGHACTAHVSHSLPCLHSAITCPWYHWHSAAFTVSASSLVHTNSIVTHGGRQLVPGQAGAYIPLPQHSALHSVPLGCSQTDRCMYTSPYPASRDACNELSTCTIECQQLSMASLGTVTNKTGSATAHTRAVHMLLWHALQLGTLDRGCAHTNNPFAHGGARSRTCWLEQTLNAAI
jgi:hypothetical protein